MSRAVSLPFKKLVAHSVSTNFRECTKIVECHELPALMPSDVLVRPDWIGVNASDINFTAGKYKVNVKPPFDVGFECVGKVVDVGSRVSRVRVGDSVGVFSFGAFAEYFKSHESTVFRLPDTRPQFLPLLVSGLTASIALEQAGNCTAKDTVLVTAAGGGTGVFAVQLARSIGCRVIATCSTESKVNLLRSLGCDVVVNTSTESLDAVLAERCGRGLDVVYESVGGETFDIAFRHLARRGRLIVIGAVSGYADGSAWVSTSASASGTDAASPGDSPGASVHPTWPMQLLAKSATVTGFFLQHFMKHADRHFARLVELTQAGELTPVIDGHRFSGLGAVVDAVDHLYSRKSQGKILVALSAEAQAKNKTAHL